MTNAEYRAVASISARAAASDLKRLVSERLLVVSDAARVPSYAAADAVKSIRARTLNPYEPDGSPFDAS